VHSFHSSFPLISTSMAVTSCYHHVRLPLLFHSYRLSLTQYAVFWPATSCSSHLPPMLTFAQCPLAIFCQVYLLLSLLHLFYVNASLVSPHIIHCLATLPCPPSSPAIFHQCWPWLSTHHLFFGNGTLFSLFSTCFMPMLTFCHHPSPVFQQWCLLFINFH
jgi:hypothetical protein